MASNATTSRERVRHEVLHGGPLDGERVELPISALAIGEIEVRVNGDVGHYRREANTFAALGGDTSWDWSLQ